MAATIKDVARRAGVAVSTASLVINNRPHVNPETKERVLQAVRELKYHPRRHARALSSQKTGNIGFVLSEDHFSRTEPFYTRIFLGTEFESRQHEYYILLTTVPISFREKTHLPRFLLEGNVDGVILAGHIPAPLCSYVAQSGMPHVYIDFIPKTPPSRTSPEIVSIMMDNRTGAEMAVEHLIELGHKRIGFLGGELAHPSIEARFEGYRNALRQHDLPYVPELVDRSESYNGVENGFRSMANLLQQAQRPTAIFATNDAMAIGAIRCLRDHRVDVPDEMSVVGFDDVEAATHSSPMLTTIRVDKEGLGAMALRRLVEMIQLKKRFSGTFFTPVELLVRQTTAPPGNSSGK